MVPVSEFHFHDSTLNQLYTGIDSILDSDSPVVRRSFKDLMQETTNNLSVKTNSNISEWTEVINSLPEIPPCYPEISEGAVTIGTDIMNTRLRKLLMRLHPWRKGPFNIHGVHIDSEWRSDMKWERIKKGITPLSGRSILDIGSGNGYYAIRAMAEGADSVLGLEPYAANVFQFLALKKYLAYKKLHTLPINFEVFPDNTYLFDTVFSMGLLYHRRSPLDHLQKVKRNLRPGGELVLETIVINGGELEVLVPKDRYARMRNVWFIPSDKALPVWLDKCGFRKIKLIDKTMTTENEQRTTEWMRYKSLPDFLDPDDSTKTIEGYPAPVRAVFTALR